MEVDIILEPDLGPAQLVELAQAAERYGIRAIWTSNYFAHWDPFISLVPVAQATKRLRMGALAVSPFEMHPLKIANALLSLNELSGGRAMAAIGAGEGNLDAMALHKPEKIVVAVREAIEIVMGAAQKKLAKDGYKGEVFNVTYPYRRCQARARRRANPRQQLLGLACEEGPQGSLSRVTPRTRLARAQARRRSHQALADAR